MPTEIPDLWGDDINVDVVPPLVILKTQAEAIGRRTKGMLTAEVASTNEKVENGKWKQKHTLLLQAPSIGYHGEELVELTHPEERYYPVSLALPFVILWPSELGGTRSSTRSCNDQDALVAALSIALTSPPTKAALNSLLARVNEKQLQKS